MKSMPILMAFILSFLIACAPTQEIAAPTKHLSEEIKTQVVIKVPVESVVQCVSATCRLFLIAEYQNELVRLSQPGEYEYDQGWCTFPGDDISICDAFDFYKRTNISRMYTQYVPKATKLKFDLGMYEIAGMVDTLSPPKDKLDIYYTQEGDYTIKTPYVMYITSAKPIE
jgi:hypothetical protein